MKLFEELFEDSKTGEAGITDKSRGLKWDEFPRATNSRNKQGNTISQTTMNYKNTYEYVTGKLIELIETSS